MKTLLGYLKPYRRECVLAPLMKLAEALLELLVPLVVASIVDEALPQGDMTLVMRSVLVLFALAAAGALVSVTAQWFSARAASLSARDIKSALLRHIQGLAPADLDRIGTASLINRMNGDMTLVQNGVNMALRLLLRSPFIVLGAAVMAFIVDARAALIFAVTIPVLSLVVYLLLRISVPRSSLAQKKLDAILRRTREECRGARVIRAFDLDDEEEAAFKDEAAVLLKTQKAAGVVAVLTNPLTSFIINLAIIAVIYYGGLRVNLGTLSQGAVIALFNYMSQILVELIKLASLVQTIMKALAGAKRVEDIFALSSSMEDGALETFDEEAPALEFDHVDFAYHQGGAKAIDDISFSLPKGAVLGVIGATGSGKSTLAALAARLYDIDSGSIRLFGHDIRDYKLSFLHSQLSFVHQKSRLMKGTIRSNLLMVRPGATQEELKAALSDAQVWPMVEEKGLDAPVESGGGNFSGGQRQRLSIARGLVHGGAILILDDSFSALDYMTDAALRNCLRKRDGLTKIIISQRASSIIDADLILVLEEGRLVGAGTNDELLRTCPVYMEIHETQFGSKEAL